MATGGKNTSQKHREFVCQPMGDTLVREVPGIGDAIGSRLSRTGIKFAKDLYARFLLDKGGFKELVEDHGGNTKHQNDAYRAMRDWDAQNN